MRFLARPFSFMHTPLGFPYCANGTLLPLTLRESSASMRNPLGKFFSYCSGETKPTNARHYCHFYGCRPSKSPLPTLRICEHATRGGKVASLGGGKERAGTAVERECAAISCVRESKLFEPVQPFQQLVESGSERDRTKNRGGRTRSGNGSDARGEKDSRENSLDSRAWLF